MGSRCLSIVFLDAHLLLKDTFPSSCFWGCPYVVAACTIWSDQAALDARDLFETASLDLLGSLARDSSLVFRSQSLHFYFLIDFLVCLIIADLLLNLDASLVHHGRPVLFIRDNFVIDLHYEVAQLGDRATHYTRRVLVTLGIIVVFIVRFSCEGVASSRYSSFEVNLESPVSTSRGHFSLSQLRCLRLICSG